MIRRLWPLAFAIGLSGCAALQDFANTINGNSSQKITRTPIWVYKPDLTIIVDAATFYGVGVTTLADETDIQIQSQVDIDRVEISTCSRHDVCQAKGGDSACDPSRFLVERSIFFGNPGKFMTYHFTPDRKERDDSCANMMIAIYDKNALAAWGYLDFRTNPLSNFPAKFTCNATDWSFQGVSVCSAKAGTIQEINFDGPVDNFRADDSCVIKKISDREFEFQPQVGWCRASFGRGEKYHDVILNGYDEVLIRDGSE
jgi:hypothetical protein